MSNPYKDHYGDDDPNDALKQIEQARRERDEAVALLATFRKDRLREILEIRQENVSLMEERDETLELLAATRKNFEAVIQHARGLRRGCDCEYDHRCGQCDAVLSVLEAIRKFDAGVS